MVQTLQAQRRAPALVAKADLAHHEQFLLVTKPGEAIWTDDPRGATTFASLREATRTAMRLPGNLRAFGLPLGADLALHATA